MSTNNKESDLTHALEYLAQLEKDVQEQYHLSRGDMKRLLARYDESHERVKAARQSQFNGFIEALNDTSSYDRNLDSDAVPVIRQFVQSILEQSIILLREGPVDQEIEDIMDRFFDPF